MLTWGNSVLQCSEDKFFTSLVKYIPKCILLFVANINRIVFLISFLICSSLYRNAINFIH